MWLCCLSISIMPGFRSSCSLVSLQSSTSFNRDVVKAGTGRRFLGGLLDDTSYCYTLEVSFYSYMTVGSTAPVPYTEETCILHVCSVHVWKPTVWRKQHPTLLSVGLFYTHSLSLSISLSVKHTHTLSLSRLTISQTVSVCVCAYVKTLVAHLLPVVATDVRWQNRGVIAASIDFTYKGKRRKGLLVTYAHSRALSAINNGTMEQTWVLSATVAHTHTFLVRREGHRCLNGTRGEEVFLLLIFSVLKSSCEPVDGGLILPIE